MNKPTARAWCFLFRSISIRIYSCRKSGIDFVSNFLHGASNVIVVASSYSYASRLIPPEKRGRQFALFNSTFFLSWGIPGTFIAGPLVDYLLKTGASPVFSYKMSFVAAATLVFMGILIMSLIVVAGKRESILS